MRSATGNGASEQTARGLTVTRAVLLVFVGVSVAALLCGCDPGVHYRPAGWSAVDEFHWKARSDGLTLVTRPIGGLIGETWLHPEIEAVNETDDSIAVSYAKLTCNGVQYTADSVGFGRPGKSLGARDTADLWLEWNLKQSIGEVLREPVSITIALLKGGHAAEVVEVPMERFRYK